MGELRLDPNRPPTTETGEEATTRSTPPKVPETAGSGSLPTPPSNSTKCRTASATAGPAKPSIGSSRRPNRPSTNWPSFLPGIPPRLPPPTALTTRRVWNPNTTPGNWTWQSNRSPLATTFSFTGNWEARTSATTPRRRCSFR
ncbi:unnamed protein product [Linum trigynum]|uniref:Uncharacterized protein n=1 Tax=Linum trigynum TaxID=586398 RepID=A0AAV2GA31_9ROSI